MPLKVSQLTKETNTVEVRVGDGPEDVVNVTYRPGALTLQMAEDASDLMNDPMAGFKIIPLMLEPVLVGWDILNEDGTPLPCDAAGIRILPLEFVGALFNRIQDASQPDPTTPQPSEDSSQREGSLVMSPTGSNASE
jgi:hypothetical protein